MYPGTWHTISGGSEFKIYFYHGVGVSGGVIVSVDIVFLGHGTSASSKGLFFWPGWKKKKYSYTFTYTLFDWYNITSRGCPDPI